ncbi:DUF4184 family protein [Streptomyces sp. NPDC097619]|uniref:DUF4184 family protein n=1 Tax=Streptomyces sp. NPDC097619 TaxID=3157228 RepID=UPI003318B03D
MPFTLAHPAAVLPLLGRGPLVPAALVAGSMAPDVSYFLGALGLTATHRTWYEPFTNASTSHAPAGVLGVGLAFTLVLLALHRLLRAPLSALLGPAWGTAPGTPPRPVHGASALARVRGVLWLLPSALIGLATHLLWDALTEPGLLPDALSRPVQYGSSALGLVALGAYLYLHVYLDRHGDRDGDRHRDRGRVPRGGRGPLASASPTARAAGLSPRLRRAVAAACGLTALGGGVSMLRSVDAYRLRTATDYDSPITTALPGGGSETSYPTRTVPAPWSDTAEALLYDLAKGAGAGLLLALLAYGAAWHLARRVGPVARGRAVEEAP